MTVLNEIATTAGAEVIAVLGGLLAARLAIRGLKRTIAAEASRKAEEVAETRAAREAARR